MSPSVSKGEESKKRELPRVPLLVPKSLRAVAESRRFGIRDDDESGQTDKPTTQASDAGDPRIHFFSRSKAFVSNDEHKNEHLNSSRAPTGAQNESATSILDAQHPVSEALQGREVTDYYPAKGEHGSGHSRDDGTQTSGDDVIKSSVALDYQPYQTCGLLQSASYPAGQLSSSGDWEARPRVRGFDLFGSYSTLSSRESSSGESSSGESSRGPAQKSVRFAEELESEIPSEADEDEGGDDEYDEHEEDSRVPGCSEREDRKDWRVANSTIAAYNAMHGSGTLEDSDLVRWAERGGGAKAEGGNELLRDHNHLLADESGPAGERIPGPDAPGRKTVFSIPRTRYDHIRLATGSSSEGEGKATVGIPNHVVRAIKRQAHREGKHDIDDKYDVSDEEGDPKDGRVSPCTFRLWATGVANRALNAGQAKAKAEDLGHHAALKNPHFYKKGARASPEDEDQPAQRRQVSISGTEGGSTTWSGPPPMIRDGFNFGLWQEHINAAGALERCPAHHGTEAERRQLEEEAFGHVGEVLTLTDDDIRAALASSESPDYFDGTPASGIEEELRRRYQRLENAKNSCKRATQGKRLLEDCIALRRPQVQEVTNAVSIIQARALQEQQVQHQDRRERRRREDIYRHVEEHLRAVAAKAEEVERSADELWAELGVLADVDDRLEDMLREMAHAIGLTGLTEPNEIADRIVQMSQEGGGEEDASDEAEDEEVDKDEVDDYEVDDYEDGSSMF
ncbi:hypothetical protein TOPH_01045 [Tolypocladium ophioglossoides CBS 100239]|uniref:Uncharacterized protein n=1 Tax=Tolypocladium ophioglossoides (strain CBS 100239) TaxID=1163406 RepID=A0A0L0NKC5_TOLOC|nr:hypothetical protein TOPH_01045 [Tolypocladium ophioglossoides CBS 100239]